MAGDRRFTSATTMRRCNLSRNVQAESILLQWRRKQTRHPLVSTTTRVAVLSLSGSGTNSHHKSIFPQCTWDGSLSPWSKQYSRTEDPLARCHSICRRQSRSNPISSGRPAMTKSPLRKTRGYHDWLRRFSLDGYFFSIVGSNHSNYRCSVLDALVDPNLWTTVPSKIQRLPLARWLFAGC